MDRETAFMEGLSALRTINAQAVRLLDDAADEQRSSMGNLNKRREAMRAFRARLGEMKWLCLQMEMALAESPYTRGAANDEHGGDGATMT